MGVAYFGGTSGTVSVGGNVDVNQGYFTSPNYVVQAGGGSITYGNGGPIPTVKGGFFSDSAFDFASSLYNATWENGASRSTCSATASAPITSSTARATTD